VARVWPHCPQRDPGPFFFDGFIPPCIGGSWWLLYLAAPNYPGTSINRWVRLILKTHTTFEPLSLHLYFTIFSVVRSLAKLVIEDQEHL
jgi:hypothetical protein